MAKFGLFLILLGGGSALMTIFNSPVQFKLLILFEPMQPWLGFAIALIGVALVVAQIVLGGRAGARDQDAHASLSPQEQGAMDAQLPAMPQAQMPAPAAGQGQYPAAGQGQYPPQGQTPNS